MSTSLYGRLRRRFAQPEAPLARQQRLNVQREEMSRLVHFDFANRQAPPVPYRACVVGAGFAGLSAAYALQGLGIQVSVIEARAVHGGRVDTTQSFIPGRTLERGAELIGRNHHLWLELARQFELGLSVITTDAEYASEGLTQPIRFGRRRLSDREARVLYDQMRVVINALTLAARVVIGNIGDPWRVGNAEFIDRQSLGTVFDRTHGRLREALEFDFSNDMTVPTSRQSLLAVYAQIAAGGFDRYWDDTEVYRCSNGNAALASSLATAIDDAERRRPGQGSGPFVTAIRLGEAVTDIKIVGNRVMVESLIPPPPPVQASVSRRDEYDYVVVAVPPSVWDRIHVNNQPIPATLLVQTGPAIKFLSHFTKRFWLAHDPPRPLAPNGVDSSFGTVWEGTDNQMGSAALDLTVFAGGPRANAVPRNDTETYFRNGIGALFGAFDRTDLVNRPDFVDWPNTRFIGGGYSIPAPGEVTGAVRQMNENPIGGKIFFAGEHVSPGFFGYMEGALQSGFKAAERIGAAAGLPMPRNSSAGTPRPRI